MPESIRCPHCRAVLSIPAHAGDRRLKCPSCRTRFYVTPFGVSRVEIPPPPGRSPASSVTAAYDPLHREPSIGPAQSVPFDLLKPVDTEAAAEQLFREGPSHRESAGDARRRARSCPDCGSTVLAGMSLCESCGLDLDTGQRADTLEVIEEVDTPYVAPPDAPVGVFLVGWASVAVFCGLSVGGFVFLANQELMGLPLLLVGLFGTFSAIQFLRGRSMRALVLSLSLAGAIDLIALVMLPIIQANETPVALKSDPNASSDEAVNPPNVVERIDPLKLSGGVVGLILVGASLIYLSTSGSQGYLALRRHSIE